MRALCTRRTAKCSFGVRELLVWQEVVQGLDTVQHLLVGMSRKGLCELIRQGHELDDGVACGYQTIGLQDSAVLVHGIGAEEGEAPSFGSFGLRAAVAVCTSHLPREVLQPRQVLLRMLMGYVPASGPQKVAQQHKVVVHPLIFG